MKEAEAGVADTHAPGRPRQPRRRTEAATALRRHCATDEAAAAAALQQAAGGARCAHRRSRARPPRPQQEAEDPPAGRPSRILRASAAARDERRDRDRRTRRPAHPAGAGGGWARRIALPAAAEARDTAQAETHAAESEHDRLTPPDRRRRGRCATASVARSPSCRSAMRRLVARREEIANQQRQRSRASLPAFRRSSRSKPRSTPPRVAFDEARQQGQQAIDAAREAERYDIRGRRRQAVAEDQAQAYRDGARPARPTRGRRGESRSCGREPAEGQRPAHQGCAPRNQDVAAALKSAADSLWPAALLDALTVEPRLRGQHLALRSVTSSKPRPIVVHRSTGCRSARSPTHRRCTDGCHDRLGDHVKTLPELARRLAFIGVVGQTTPTGAALQEWPQGRPSSSVTRDGAVWR